MKRNFANHILFMLLVGLWESIFFFMKTCSDATFNKDYLDIELPALTLHCMKFWDTFYFLPAFIIPAIITVIWIFFAFKKADLRPILLALLIIILIIFFISLAAFLIPCTMLIENV